LLIALVLVLGGLMVRAPDHVAAAEMCFQETRFCIQGQFLAYWQDYGGLAIDGFPLSDERQEVLEDGRTYTVQYFERVRMEYHPENQPPYDVLLGQFGRRILQLPGPRNFRGVEPAAAPLPGQVYFAETGHNLGGRFLDYWQQHGGLAQFGFPLTEEANEQLGTQFYRVQYFERARLELHPENQPPYDVLLGQFGRRVLLARFRGDRSGYDQAVAPVAVNPDDAYFPATGHNLGGPFLAYWQANGGLAQFGFPLTEPFGETLDDGQFYTVQYFERARFEAHPENSPPYDVLLGQFGRAIEAETRLLSGSFGALYTTNEDVRARLGRPVAPATQAAGATLAFEHGRMIWRGDQRRIYVLCGAPTAGQLVTNRLPYFDDTWTAGQDPGGGPGPTPGLFLPARGFGKVWRENQNVQQCLGYATAAAETGYTLTVQDFERGVLLTADTPEGRFIYAVNYDYACNSCGAEGGYERFSTAMP
jgi:hypothetical protein